MMGYDDHLEEPDFMETRFIYSDRKHLDTRYAFDVRRVHFGHRAQNYHQRRSSRESSLLKCMVLPRSMKLLAYLWYYSFSPYHCDITPPSSPNSVTTLFPALDLRPTFREMASSALGS